MALQFREPPDWLIQEYMNRKSEPQQILDSAMQAAQLYSQIKNRSKLTDLKAQEGKRQEEELNIQKAKNARDQGEYARNYEPASLPGAGGAYNQFSPQDFGSAEPTLTGDSQMRSLLTQSGGPATLGPSVAQPGQPPSLMDRFNKWQTASAGPGIGMGQNTDLAPAPQNYKEQANLDFARQFPYGGKFSNTGHDQKRTYSPQTYLDAEGNAVVGRFDTRSGNPEIQDASGEWKTASPGTLRGYAPQYGIDPTTQGLIKKTAVGATAVPSPATNLNPLQTKLNPKEYDDFIRERDKADADPVIKTDRTMLATLNQIDNEINKYNKSLTGPLRSQQARAIAREVGALTDSDIVRQSLDPSLLGRLKSWVSVAATGEIPDDQLESLRQTVKTIKESASGRINTVYKDRANRLSLNVGGKVSPDEFMNNMNLPTGFSIGQRGGLTPEERAEKEALERELNGQ